MSEKMNLAQWEWAKRQAKLAKKRFGGREQAMEILRAEMALPGTSREARRNLELIISALA